MYKEILESGSCTQTDPDVFFPDLGRGDLTKIAKKICSNCVVLDLCLETAIDDTSEGILAGMTANERQRLRNVRV
jgi:hypothetical protein